MPNSENCEHGFYQSRGCNKCAALVEKFKAGLLSPRCCCNVFEPSENHDRCPLHGTALAAYDKAKRPTPAVAADTEALVEEAEDWKRRAGEQRTRHYERGLVDRLIASLRKGAGT